MQANLEKQVKELNVRIVDLETKSLNSPRPAPSTARRLESRIEELTNQLNQQASKDSSVRAQRTGERNRDARLQIAEVERQKNRLEEEVKASEGKIQTLRETIDKLVRAHACVANILRSERVF